MRSEYVIKQDEYGYICLISDDNIGVLDEFSHL
jgi:hypothetical protein